MRIVSVTDADAAAADQLLEPSGELLLRAIETVVVSGDVGQLLTGDHLVGDGIQIDLNQGHRSDANKAQSWQQ